ncbi:calmodulin-binding protein 60 C-like [Curcuma longa]|uniref:calmodulin-binding protein 60 C-like n=1 Tax=Curcuma longa TaxID=136217 RepID=UPI003D9E9EFD
MRRDKQAMEASDGEECLPPLPKRQRPPALAGHIHEALRRHHLTRFFSILEPNIRRIVSEELERALASRMTPVRTVEGCPGDKILQLRFRNKLSHTILTGEAIRGELGAAVHVLLFDAKTGRHVTSGPEASVKLDVVVLHGDFDKDDDDDWTATEFEEYIVKPREGKRPLLIGETQVCLKEGVGTLGKITFTDNSSWIRSRKFRLGLKVAAGFCDGTRIREAKTEGFMVKEQRAHGKHHPPGLEDEIWRLESIGKDGPYQKKLNEENIRTVGDFLFSYFKDSKKLQKILGNGMSNNKWEKLVNHAMTTVLNEKRYVYYPDETRQVGAIFNSGYEFCGLIENEQFTAKECFNDDHQKGLADKLICKAYDNWKDVSDYEGNLTSIQSESIVASQGAALPSSSSPNGFLGMPNEMGNAAVNDTASLSPAEHMEHQYRSGTFDGLSPLDEEFIRSLTQQMIDDNNLLCSDDMVGFASSTSSYSDRNLGNEEKVRPRTSVVTWVTIVAALRWAIFIRRKAAERKS